MAKDRCIVVDWGTTNVRAYRLAGDGRILERRESRQGIMNVADGGFRAALDAVLADWRGGGDTPVVLSGMIGSRQGWVEAPYAERSEEHTSELQTIMRLSYSVFCLNHTTHT